MKVNKLTSALVALGLVSLASAYAANPVVYLTGSTAARANIFTAMTASGQVFDAGSTGTVVSPSPNNTSSSSLIVYEGKINGTTVDIDCSWTGSEAGIAAVAGQPLTQNVNGGTYSLPGVPPSFLTQSSSWAANSATTLNNIPGAPANPDLSMADTSQAVSQTPKASYPLTDYGIVGIVSFTFMKGYQSVPDATYNNFVNVTTGQANQNLTVGYNYNANNYTGVASDANEGVAIDGRNKGSGTRANALVNLQVGINTPVLQYSFDADYPANNPGVLTFGDAANGGPDFAAGQNLVQVGNDGYDSGGSVGESLQVDGSNLIPNVYTNPVPVIVIGYLGISDAKNANTAGHYVSGQGGAAKYLSYNGVFESDSNIIWGAYSYWGQEHLMGSIGQSSSSQAGQVATAIVTGLAKNLISTGAGAASADVRTNPSQSAILPVALMQVHRTADGGFPIQGGF
jgi:hypothetical protein